ncbi:MAG: hypothetical protein GWO07_08590 [Candidatus Dadabacteria bacterium]|nr:hypothetical protein [Candidatus Dadabacteria bacterium]NIS08804.1 hypothetical protein [Candidatus Dadabacteria bacterium]NIY22154.1 hypothetical protein [Candidatus Dadabacteria bacterium]
MLSTFPFGWVKNIDSENWQLLWDSINKKFYAKGAKSKKVIQLADIPDWFASKKFADEVLTEPYKYFPS